MRVRHLAADVQLRVEAVAVFGEVRLRHHPEQPVRVLPDIPDDLALVEDGFVDALDGAPCDLGADRLVAVAACFACFGCEVVVDEGAELAACAFDAGGAERTNAADARVVTELGEELVALLRGELRCSELEVFGQGRRVPQSTQRTR